MSRKLSLDSLRAQAVSQSLITHPNLASAMKRLAFVQADPIRSPAAAQDLILRHRVKGYRDGDLDRSYAALEIEEDFLYAYGFLSREIRHLLYPRKLPALTKFDRKVLEVVEALGQAHPRDLEERCGAERVVNAWGGYSKATKRSLEQLHYHGHLRVARRERGVRIYEPTTQTPQSVSADERCRRLAMVIAHLLSPAPLKSLQETVTRLGWSSPDIGSTKTVLKDLLHTGELEMHEVDGINYVFTTSPASQSDVLETVRILAPFDPVVWDRRRFEHLFDWVYRFEAYTPPAKRVRGYYAMPLLWRDRVIGWVNASLSGTQLDADVGFHGKRPRDTAFRNELDAEISRLEEFLKSKKR